jgi:hypothetical protein
MTVAASDAVLRELRGLGLTEEVRRLELPEVMVVGPWRIKKPTRKAMLGGRFYVYGHASELRTPIDWHQDPHQSRSWRYELHTLTWLKEALARHALGGDIEVLAVARDVVLDWAQSHLRSNEESSEFAWYDMAVGLRAPYVGYVLRACLAEDMLDDRGTELLLEAVERHGAELADGDNYAAGNNHGLFQDEGLYLLARQLSTLPAAAAWRELALTRLKTTLAETVSFRDGAHLEHSPAYQLAIVDLLARLAANVADLPELGPLLDRMRRTAAWQVTPAGRMAQLGDTDDLPAPNWARDASSSLRGMNPLFEAGQAFVREGKSYLAVSAAYHGPAHKHADDTGFLLVENGQVVLGDAGRWGYYEDEPHRLYARSAAAHNVLTVDDQDFEWRAAEPYGSGLEAAGECDGWYAIAVRNPLLASQGVDHRRILLYRPAQALLVLDEVRSPAAHEHTRRFHLGSELEAEQVRPGCIAIAGKGLAATLTDPVGDAEISLARGQDDPHAGWAYPGDRETKAVWTAALRSRADSATLTCALTLDRAPIEVTGVEITLRHVELELDGTSAVTVPLSHRQRSE